MRTIRFRLTLIAFVTLAATMFFAWRANQELLLFKNPQAKVFDWQTFVAMRGKGLSGATRLPASGATSVAQPWRPDWERLRRAEKFSTLAVLTPILGLLLTFLVVRSGVFKPLARLSKRMMDFLIDRYSFQFAQPESSEFGDMQRTFNSLAQQVINTRDELMSLDQAKSEFLNIASHELRTPLTSIKGSLSLLGTGVMGNVDANSLRLIRIAEGETDRLIRLINDLLDLAKIEAGRLPLACAWLPWSDIAARTTEGLIGLGLKANVRINVEEAQSLELFIDRDRIQQVLTNLISNAIKFSPDGGEVRISYERQGHLTVRVTDQGPGIAPQDQEMIFQKFRQGSNPDNPLVKGTGLGLAIAKALVHEHGGEIGVESKVGHGSTFWFTLPKWRDEEIALEKPKSKGLAA